MHIHIYMYICIYMYELTMKNNERADSRYIFMYAYEICIHIYT